MNSSSPVPRSDGPSSPQITSLLHSAEKSSFVGVVTGAVLYGIVVVLFFQCITAWLDPVNRQRGGFRWGLVAHTTAIFSSLTICNATGVDVTTESFIDNRAFPGGGLLPPGPVGFQGIVYLKPVGIFSSITLILTNLLTDGLLLYRCYAVYGLNYWAVALPFLMYLASLAIGIVFVYQSSQPNSFQTALGAGTGIPYFSIVISLNVLLTLLIVMRILWHTQSIRKATGALAKSCGLYNSIVTMTVESCALCTVASLIFVGLWAARNWIADAFLPILAQTQVIAPLLVILRVANQKALTSKTVIPGSLDSVRFRRASAEGCEPVSSRRPMDVYGKSFQVGKPGARDPETPL